MKNLFFYKLYLFDKRLFVALLVFSGLTLLCNIKGDEITPFFIWAMYSEKEPTNNRYEIFRIQLNDSTIVDYTSDYTDNNRLFLTAPLSYFNRIKQNNFAEPTLMFLQRKLAGNYGSLQSIAEKIHKENLNPGKFIEWYVRYLQQSTGKPVHDLKIDVLVARFAAGKSIQIDSSYSLLQWKQP